MKGKQLTRVEMVPEWFWREWTWTKSTGSVRLLEMWKVQTHTMSSYWLKSYGIIYFLPYQIRTHPLQLFCALLAFSHNRQLHHIMWIREALWFKAMGLQDKSLPLPSTALFLIQRFWCRALVNSSQFFQRYSPTVISIQGFEHFFQAHDLFLWQVLCNNLIVTEATSRCFMYY